MTSIVLTEKEQAIMEKLAGCWNDFNDLPVRHKWDQLEFMDAIHKAQNIILARPVKAQMYEAKE